MDLEVFFDYTCGFSNRARHWLDAVDGIEVRWRPFSLLERNRGDDGPSVFERDELGENVSLIALAVHMAVRADGADVDGYRRRMFTAWHEEPGRLSTQDIVGLGRAAGLHDWDHDAALALLAAEHAEASALGVFGTPTLTLAEGTPVFVKLDATPAPERAQPLWDQVHQVGADAPELHQWQRVLPTSQEAR